MPNTTNSNNIKDIIFGNTICYFCSKRNGFIYYKNNDKTLDRERFFIDNTQLTFEQISNYENYRQIRDLYIPYEEWKIDPEFPGYQFSSLGRLKLKSGIISQILPISDGYVKTQLKRIKNLVSI